MKSPSMCRNLSFIKHFFRVEDWRDRCLWHQSFNFFLLFFNIPVYLEKGFIFKAVFKSLHNLSGFYWPWAFSWLRFSLFLHLHQRWGVGSASATLREIHRVIISQALWLLFDPPGNDTSSGPSAKLFFPLWTWPRRRGSSCRKPFHNGLDDGGDRVRRWWEGWSSFIKQKCLFVMFVMRMSPPRLLLYPWQQQQRLPCRRYNEKCSEITAQYQCL